MQRYFVFSNNIMAVNCIHTDIQDRANGCDFDSDFFFVTNNEVIYHILHEILKIRKIMTLFIKKINC